MEETSHLGHTQNGCSLASGWLPALLEMALQGQAVRRQKIHEQRDSRLDFPHGRRESYLGSAAHPRRAVDARLRSLGNNRFAMASASPENSRSGQALAGIPAEPSRGDCSHGLLHGTDAHLRCSVLLLYHRSLAQLCQEKLQADPFSGCLFVFRSRRGTSIRILVYDGQGFWLAQKRLSKGRFVWWPSGNQPTRVLEAPQAQLLLAAGNPDAIAAPVWRRVSA